MNLDEAQKNQVATWLKEGLKLSEIQNRLTRELNINLTYMEVRLLVDDLRLKPKDVEPPRTAELGQPGSQPPQPRPAPLEGPKPSEPSAGAGRVAVKVDSLARPGAVVSGNVTFSDGQQAEWYLDQLGRLGLVPQQQGYRPSQSDVMTFQTELQEELARLGF